MSLGADDAKRLEDCLAGDGVALIPTDTVYGLACNPESETALQRIYELKGRPALKPAAVMFFAREPALESLSELGPRTRAALGALLPGPVTLLLENSGRRFPLACDPGGGSGAGLLGLRVPLLRGSARRAVRYRFARGTVERQPLRQRRPARLAKCAHRVARRRRPRARRWRASRRRLHRDRPVRVRAERTLADRARGAARLRHCRSGARPSGIASGHRRCRR